MFYPKSGFLTPFFGFEITMINFALSNVWAICGMLMAIVLPIVRISESKKMMKFTNVSVLEFLRYNYGIFNEKIL